ncbi:hypothetical protein WJX81_008169 [Elliptochloris bilobata]|uniref:RanBD1 domain-containing protein n=1 Tax=Elliptochloris bilobata TaxID=381761 RepID=A0AAW1R2A0_9CHLO
MATQDDKAKTQTPVFGSSSTFGGASGFGGFAGVEKPAEHEEGAEEGTAEGEEDCSAEFKPLVQLEEVERVSGEEAEDVMLDLKSKLYRFDNDSGEWKERGVGQTRLLKNKENQRIRLLMRQEKTLKIRANHLVLPGTKLQEHSGSEKAWVYSTVDFAEEEQKMELFCLRFGSLEKAQEFKKHFEEAMAHNDKVLEAEGDEGEDAAAAAAEDKAAAAKEEEADLADKVGKVSVADKAEGTEAPGINGAKQADAKDAKD